MNSNQRSIQHVMAAKQVTSLVHFTPMQNLDSIVNNDLLSRDQCKRVGVQPTTTDNFRYDGLLDYISVSISFPNDRMFVTPREQIGVLFSLKDYLQLVDTTGRMIRIDKRGAIPINEP